MIAPSPRLIAYGIAAAAVVGAVVWIRADAYDRGEADAQAACRAAGEAAQAGIERVAKKHDVIARDLYAAEAEIDRLLEDLQDEARDAGDAVCPFDADGVQRLNDAAGFPGAD